MPRNAAACRIHVALAPFACLILVFAAILLTACPSKQVAAVPSPPEVQVTDAVQKDVPITEEWVAQLNGPINAEITPKVQGYLLSQAYTNGFPVKKGQLLFELDPRQFQASLEQAKAALAKSQANLERFQNDVARDKPLAAQNAIPQKQLENDIANVKAAEAQIQADNAAVQNAQLNLGWTKIYSPIDGIAGDAKSQIGDLVGTSTKMTTISKVDPIWASFSISESAYLGAAGKISQLLRSGKVPKNSKALEIQYVQANSEPYPHRGRIVQVNRQVAAGTGTIQFTAEFPNPDAILRPGGFGRVRLQTSDLKDALLVPQSSVIEIQSEYQVVVVSQDNKAKFRPVKVGQRVGQDWIVTDGLKPGERVVAEGLLKIQQAAAAAPDAAQAGIPVTPKPYVAAAGTKAGSN